MNNLNGKKTYIVAAATVLGAVCSAITGAITWEQAAQLSVTAILGATVRHGVDNASK